MLPRLTRNLVKTIVADMKDIETISQPRRAATLLNHPIRPTILAHARDPISASELARRLEQPRQRINYHVRQLADTGFLQPAGQQRKRNMVEQQYVASARSYVFTPDVLGDAAPSFDSTHDVASAAHLVALCGRAQSDVAQVMESAHAAGLRIRTLSMMSDLRFNSVEQRTAFTAELFDAISDMVARHSAPQTASAQPDAAGRPFRLVLGCYPIPTQNAK